MIVYSSKLNRDDDDDYDDCRFQCTDSNGDKRTLTAAAAAAGFKFSSALTIGQLRVVFAVVVVVVVAPAGAHSSPLLVCQVKS